MLSLSDGVLDRIWDLVALVPENIPIDILLYLNIYNLQNNSNHNNK